MSKGQSTLSMKTSLLLLAFALLGTAHAALIKIHARYERLDLKDGRRLENVVVQTYDTMKDRVVVLVEGREATTVPLTVLPDEVAALVRERIPLQSEDEMATESTHPVEGRADTRQREKDLDRHARIEAEADARAVRRFKAKEADTIAAPRGDRAAANVAAAAEELARHYFLYEADPHSSIGRVYDTQLMLDSPEPVSGWTDRWRVRGKVGLQYVTRNIGAMGRETRDFEMLIEAPAGAPPKLVDITVNP